MALPSSYTQKPNSIPAYLDAMVDAQAPDRFNVKFMENLGFTSTNDRLFVGILKELGFINQDGLPQRRYYEFLDRTQSRKVIAEGIKEAFADFFTVNTKANELPLEDVRNKLRTLYAGKKSDLTIDRIAGTFVALCEYADFSSRRKKTLKVVAKEDQIPLAEKIVEESKPEIKGISSSISLDSLQYHINIVLPESRDQGVYDAIFKSLRDHLGARNE